MDINIINEENDISDDNDDETETIEIDPKIFEILFKFYSKYFN